jgi:hypothetical protein
MVIVLQDAMADMVAADDSTMASGARCLAKRLLTIDEEPGTTT